MWRYNGSGGGFEGPYDTLYPGWDPLGVCEDPDTFAELKVTTAAVTALPCLAWKMNVWHTDLAVIITPARRLYNACHYCLCGSVEPSLLLPVKCPNDTAALAAAAGATKGVENALLAIIPDSEPPDP